MFVAELGDTVLHHPREAWGLFQEVVYTVLQWLPGLSGSSQLLILGLSFHTYQGGLHFVCRDKQFCKHIATSHILEGWQYSGATKYISNFVST